MNDWNHSGWCYLSASSKITILCRPGCRVTFFCANILILFRTTSSPLQKHESTIMHPIRTLPKAAPNRKNKTKKMSRRQQPVVRGVELEHGLAVAGPKQLVGQRQNARRLPSPRRTLRERKGEKGDELRCSRPLRG